MKKDLELVFKNPEYKINLPKNERINLWVHQKATFSSISNLAEELNTNLKLIIKHPIFENVMYVMGKK
jgi:hypothetical protein